LKEALSEEFKEYQRQVVRNAGRLADELRKKGFTIVSGGTENHLMLIDLTDKNITGKEAEEAMDLSGITVNKNAIPFDPRPPAVTSGIRLGTPCVTTRGMGEAEMTEIAALISEVLEKRKNSEALGRLNGRVKKLCQRFPIYR
jgi:glycine hydroxymethyltransferase